MSKARLTPVAVVLEVSTSMKPPKLVEYPVDCLAVETKIYLKLFLRESCAPMPSPKCPLSPSKYEASALEAAGLLFPGLQPLQQQKLLPSHTPEPCGKVSRNLNE